MQRRRFLITSAGIATSLWAAACVAEEGEGPPVEGSEPPPPPDDLPCDPVLTTFPMIVDNEDTASFTRMDESAITDWLTIGLATSNLMTGHVAVAVLNLLRRLEALTIGYPVDLLTHSLQTATRATQDGASDDLVLAALCHRVGMAITVEGHAEVSAAIVRGHVSEDVYRVVRHLPEFEWHHYGDLIGQPIDQRERYAGEAWYADAVKFCDEWVAPSFDPTFETMPLSGFEPLLREAFGGGSLVSDITAEDCI